MVKTEAIDSDSDFCYIVSLVQLSSESKSNSGKRPAVYGSSEAGTSDFFISVSTRGIRIADAIEDANGGLESASATVEAEETLRKDENDSNGVDSSDSVELDA
ncbi:hypothetical protein L2E82_17260 [Cichorium intybus]|uniref:Uncharacterized protein n=1 Tax=Cichorium intybus TaxID=13427 RepID=A0ACB9F8G8_CICIN|nr:hypothetical protein L2E82_17260 [Cichorium intybus]